MTLYRVECDADGVAEPLTELVRGNTHEEAAEIVREFLLYEVERPVHVRRLTAQLLQEPDDGVGIVYEPSGCDASFAVEEGRLGPVSAQPDADRTCAAGNRKLPDEQLAEMSREELAEIVAKTYTLAFLDMDREGEFWNVDKPLDADSAEEVRDVLASHGLRPQSEGGDAHSCLQDFVNDVEAVGPETVQEDWPDLYATYQEAVRLL